MKLNRKQIYKKFGGHCAYCGIKIKLKEMQVDHIYAKGRGGNNQRINLYPACRSCNASKATYTIEEFRKRLIDDVDRLRRDSAKYRILERFGIIGKLKTHLKFYFEE